MSLSIVLESKLGVLKEHILETKENGALWWFWFSEAVEGDMRNSLEDVSFKALLKG